MLWKMSAWRDDAPLPPCPGDVVYRWVTVRTVHEERILQRVRLLEPRTDVWPEPKVASEAEERFLKLPDAEDYTRVRQFNIDKKGAVVSRGDSFRRKKTTKCKGMG